MPNHRGKCSRPHGHSYRVEVVLVGSDVCTDAGASGEGMLVDFGIVAEAWKLIEDQLDHRNLNETVPPAFHPTTAENIARLIFEHANSHGLPVVRVTVWETPTSFAEYRASD